MNILYYIPKISRKDGGIYQYAYNLLSELAANSDIDTVFFVQQELPDQDFKRLCNENDNLILISGRKALEPIYSKILRRTFQIIKNLFEEFKVPFKLKVRSEIFAIIKKYRISVVHCPHQTLPLRIEVPSIVTLHDIQELYFPEFFSPEQRKVRAINNYYSTKEANAIVVSYNHIKLDIIKFFKVNKEKVHKILLNMDKLWFNQIKASENFTLELPFKDYILYPAATWEHKNHTNLFKALKRLQKKNLYINLICTGARTDYAKLLDSLIDDLGLNEQILFKGIVSDEELFHLYNSAKAVVIPTLYEAGSFPLYESIFLKVPVICSNVTSLPETIGDKDFIFNPKDPKNIANKIEQIVLNEDYRLKNIKLLEKRKVFFENADIYGFFKKIYSSIAQTTTTELHF